MSCTAELLAISRITPGQTYSPVYRTVVVHGTWSAAFWRRYHRESRYTVIYSLENLFKEALNDATNHLLIEKALLGCRNLQITYKDDNKLVEKLEEIITTTEAAIRTAQIPVNTQEFSPDHEIIQIENSPLACDDIDILTVIINRILDEMENIQSTLDEILTNICSGAGNLAIEIRKILDKFPNSPATESPP